ADPPPRDFVSARDGEREWNAVKRAGVMPRPAKPARQPCRKVGPPTEERYVGRTRSTRISALPCFAAPASPAAARRSHHPPNAPRSPSALPPRRSLGGTSCSPQGRQPEALAQDAQQGRVVGVARLARHHATSDRTAEQVEVAQDVEDLVAHELVREA